MKMREYIRVAMPRTIGHLVHRPFRACTYICIILNHLHPRCHLSNYHNHLSSTSTSSKTYIYKYFDPYQKTRKAKNLLFERNEQPGTWLPSGVSDSGKQAFYGTSTEDEESSWRRHAPGFLSLCFFCSRFSFSFSLFLFAPGFLFLSLCFFFGETETCAQVGVLAAAGLFALDHQVFFIAIYHQCLHHEKGITALHSGIPLFSQSLDIVELLSLLLSKGYFTSKYLLHEHFQVERTLIKH